MSSSRPMTEDSLTLRLIMRRPRTVLEYNDEAYLVQVTISTYRIEELFNLKVDSLMN